MKTRMRRAIAIAAVPVCIGLFFVGRSLYWSLKATPNFDSLVTTPDTTLTGTVAFFKPYPNNECVYLVRASGGQAVKSVCVGGDGQLEWLDDGRLQVTMYGRQEDRADDKSVIIDVRAKTTESVPLEKIPEWRDITEVTGPNGEKVVSKSRHGQLTVKLTDTSGTRELLKVGAPDTYTFGLPSWSPDAKWFVVKDDKDRLLTITVGSVSTTRVLVEGGYWPAVTNLDVLGK